MFVGSIEELLKTLNDTTKTDFKRKIFLHRLMFYQAIFSHRYWGAYVEHQWQTTTQIEKMLI